MLTLLSRFFIKKDDTEERQRTAWGNLCGICGIFFNLLLTLSKLAAGFFTHSISIVADAMNNLSDVLSSVVTIAGFKLSAQKADPEHPYGHGRIEYVSGFIVSTLIIIMAYELVRDSVLRIVHPEKTTFSLAAIAILLFSICIKLYMMFYNSSIGKKIGSLSLKAVAKDSMSDCISTAIVTVAQIVSARTGFIYLDGICGIVVGLFVAYEGLSSAKDTLNPLLGEAPDPHFTDKVREIMLEQDPRISGIHDLIVHDYGPGKRMVSLHAEVPADGNLVELHEVIDAAEDALEEKLNCEAVIHMDPIVTDDPKVLSLKNKVLSIIEEVNPSLSLHDFRIVKESKAGMDRMFFDILVPYGFDMSESELKSLIKKLISEKIGPYDVSIHVDTDYSVRSV
ncbi:MAG: cation transporter [Lachnospiraceae bacterium]|uniref:Cation transporter n=1 Tax=Candidatus Weimeria bifida TaxID=2599074 RepID=A0A6N7J0F0_9FIRM|nr:cation transporter [Candidatus Weimeria bifida]RRF95552.1 MAG: cation transporter [Lachnospiraceae bacterium]